MISRIQNNVKPISDYAAVLAEMEQWKEKFYDLQSQITAIRQSSKDTIIIKESGTAKYIRLADIIMMEAESNYTTIYFADGHRILTSRTLKYWIMKIGNHTDFIRPHRSFLVNKTHILQYQISIRSLILSNGRKAQVARSYTL